MICIAMQFSPGCVCIVVEMACVQGEVCVYVQYYHPKE
jgi:hypothetical protein